MVGWNAVVTFENLKTGEKTDRVLVKIDRVSLDGQLGKESVEFPWTVTFDSTVRYPSGKRVSHGHQINTTKLPNGYGTLDKPQHDFGFMEQTIAGFKQED